MAPSKNRSTPGTPAAAALPMRSVALWLVVGIAVLAGILLYFRYERSLTPLVG